MMVEVQYEEDKVRDDGKSTVRRGYQGTRSIMI